MERYRGQQPTAYPTNRDRGGAAAPCLGDTNHSSSVDYIRLGLVRLGWFFEFFQIFENILNFKNIFKNIFEETVFEVKDPASNRRQHKTTQAQFWRQLDPPFVM